MKVIKFLFICYVIMLAGYVTYKKVLLNRYGSHKVQFTKPQKACHEGGLDWNYCVYTSERTNNKAYLYVFHGKDEDEHFWADETGYPALLQKYWQDDEAKIPKVIVISFGPTWVISPHLSKPVTGLLERFEAEVFPKVESALGSPQKRFLLGASMGGLNAAMLSLNMPKKFSRMAFICPPFYKMSPFAHWKEVVNFIVRTGAKPKSAFMAIGLGRYLFADEEEWKIFSPLQKILEVRYQPYQKFYISTGLRDEFGAFEGSLDFVEKLRRTGAITYWHPHSGDHCAVDIQTLGDFLSL